MGDINFIEQNSEKSLGFASGDKIYHKFNWNEVSANVVERLEGYVLYERTGDNLPVYIWESFPNQLYAVETLRHILFNETDDTNETVKNEIYKMYEKAKEFVFFSIS